MRNGFKINVWTDKWVPDVWHNQIHSQQPQGSDNNLKVYELMNPHTGNWGDEKIRNLILYPMVDKVLAISLRINL